MSDNEPEYIAEEKQEDQRRQVMNMDIKLHSVANLGRFDRRWGKRTTRSDGGYGDPKAHTRVTGINFDMYLKKRNYLARLAGMPPATREFYTKIGLNYD